MKIKKMFGRALAGVVAVGCLCVSAGAFELRGDSTNAQAVGLSSGVTRATGSFNMEIAGGELVVADKELPLEAGETVTINASYSPLSASVDFGLIDSDGTYYYLTVTGGSINKTIEIEERGNYTLAVRNNSDNSVRVSGFVNY